MQVLLFTCLCNGSLTVCRSFFVNSNVLYWLKKSSELLLIMFNWMIQLLVVRSSVLMISSLSCFSFLLNTCVLYMKRSWQPVFTISVFLFSQRWDQQTITYSCCNINTFTDFIFCFVPKSGTDQSHPHMVLFNMALSVLYFPAPTYQIKKNFKVMCVYQY